VKRRAILSIVSNPACKSEEMATKVVNEVWESCFKDTRPFDEVCHTLRLENVTDI
jgi:inner membrane protease ATP23